MTTNDPTTQTLTDLGVTDAAAVTRIFSDVRGQFERQLSKQFDDVNLKMLSLAWTGRKSGVLTRIRENWLHKAPVGLKAAIGQEYNALDAHVKLTLDSLRAAIVEKADAGAMAAVIQSGSHVAATLTAIQGSGESNVFSVPVVKSFDLSLPGIERPIGTRHLIRQTYDELLRIFTAIGFSVVAGPEIETPYYNFEALNIPEHHPARDNMDTFYIAGARGGHLLRTHTSPMQIRTMEKQKPPVRIVVPGKVYRRDNPDATHGYMFHQIEGLAVDTDITFCDFKGTVDYFAREFLGPKTKTRLRPSYFPFTEPSAEVDATCHVCGGSGCRVCKQSGWIELFGAGMVNPAVYGFVGYDPEKYSGFAFGMGVDRLAMMKYGVTEVPLLFQNDVRFLKQFP
jgi:phenylalanyl-tRNA synthetase alpha chain